MGLPIACSLLSLQEASLKSSKVSFWFQTTKPSIIFSNVEYCVICCITEMSICKAGKNLANQKRIHISLQTAGYQNKLLGAVYILSATQAIVLSACLFYGLVWRHLFYVSHFNIHPLERLFVYKELLTFESVDGEVSSQIVAIQIIASEQYIL